MAGLTVKFDIKHAAERYRRIQKKAQNPKTMMDVIAIKAWKDVIQHFRDERGPDETPWKPLSLATEKGRRKGRKKKRNKILQDTGRLRMANRYKAGKSEVKVFNNVHYAKYHDRGKGVPKRTFMYVNSRLALKFAQDLNAWIAEG